MIVRRLYLPGYGIGHLLYQIPHLLRQGEQDNAQRPQKQQELDLKPEMSGDLGDGPVSQRLLLPQQEPDRQQTKPDPRLQSSVDHQVLPALPPVLLQVIEPVTPPLVPLRAITALDIEGGLVSHGDGDSHAPGLLIGPKVTVPWQIPMLSILLVYAIPIKVNGGAVLYGGALAAVEGEEKAIPLGGILGDIFRIAVKDFPILGDGVEEIPVLLNDLVPSLRLLLPPLPVALGGLVVADGVAVKIPYIILLDDSGGFLLDQKGVLGVYVIIVVIVPVQRPARPHGDKAVHHL